MTSTHFATFAATATILVAGSAHATAFCELPDGSMGMQCIVQSSGQVYGCVADLKECGALRTPVYSLGDDSTAFAIKEQGIRALEAGGHEFAIRVDGGNGKRGANGKTMTARYDADAGLRVTVRGWNPTVKANAAARKVSHPVEGYQLFIALPGYLVTVDDDGTLEFAIKEQGVKRAKALGVDVTIETSSGGKKGFDQGAKDGGYRFQHNQTDLEFIVVRGR